MVNSKHGDGLIFPKGGWETDESAEEAAARESMEEAGVRGHLLVGAFTLVHFSAQLERSLWDRGCA